MKLIIEIPIDLLERTKSGDYNFGDDLARNEVIANGTPYNPSGDCISREALIKKLEEMANNEWNIQVGSSKGLEDAIDVVENAETVEPERTQCNQIVWEQGYECGYHQAKEDVIRRIKEQYNEHHELIPCWLSVGDLKGGAE